MTENQLKYRLRQKLVKLLESRGWLVEPMPANSFQRGAPRLYCHHPQWGSRWVEVLPEGCSFTARQRRRLPLWLRAGVKIWVLTAESDYNRLLWPPNLDRFWKGPLPVPDVEHLPDEADRDAGQLQVSTEEA